MFYAPFKACDVSRAEPEFAAALYNIEALGKLFDEIFDNIGSAVWRFVVDDEYVEGSGSENTTLMMLSMFSFSLYVGIITTLFDTISSVLKFNKCFLFFYYAVVDNAAIEYFVVVIFFCCFL